jgi:hypothetical protein
MGMDRKVTLPADTAPVWATLADFLNRRAFVFKMMMIDGQLSFPDEQPPESWQELRLGTSAGMITLRRETGGVRVVTWGNAEGPLRDAWNVLCWALGEVFEGTIEDGTDSLSPANFARRVGLQIT